MSCSTTSKGVSLWQQWQRKREDKGSVSRPPTCFPMDGDHADRLIELNQRAQHLPHPQPARSISLNRSGRAAPRRPLHTVRIRRELCGAVLRWRG